MAKLTEAEMTALYDSQRSGAAWLKVQAITDDPTDAGAVWDEIIGILTNDQDDGSEDTPLSDVEARIIEALYPDLPPRTAEFARGYAVGLAIGRALEPEATDDIISILEAIDGGE